jgi:hypothetical protein
LESLKVKILFFFGIILFLHSSCSSSYKEQTNIIASDSAKILAEGYNNKGWYEGPCIVVLWPDSIQIEKLKAKDSDAFYAGADDYSFYTSKIMELADSLNIKSYSTNKNDIDFETTDKKLIAIDRSKLKEEDASWGIYLFNGVDTPKINSSIDLDKAFLKKFFKK